MKLLDVLNARKVLISIKDKPLTVGFSYALGKLLKSIESEYEIFEECRISLIKTMGSEPDETGKVAVKKELEELFFSKLNELVSQPVDDSKFIKLNLKIFPEDFKISPEEFSLLEPFIEG